VDKNLSRKTKFLIGKTMSHLVESKIRHKRDDLGKIMGFKSAGGHEMSCALKHLREEKLVETEKGLCFI